MTRTLVGAALLIALLGPELLLPALARADRPVVLARLPRERQAEMTAALRLELAGRATLVEGPALEGEPSVSSLREEARVAGASHVVWVVFPGGLLVPAEVRALDVQRTAPAHASTPQAWDVVDPRIVAVVAATLFEVQTRAASEAEAGAETETEAGAETETETEAETETETETEAEAETETETGPGAGAGAGTASGAESGAGAGTESGTESASGAARDARTFWLSYGLGIAHTAGPGQAEGIAFTGSQLGFYGRVSEWASLGLRLRLNVGASSIEGAILYGSIALPSIALSFRESLGTAAAIEIGVHAEGGLYVDWMSSRVRGADELSFGLGGGAFATLELGAANGLQLDYTISVYGLGGTATRTWGSGTLSYVHRWD